MSRSTLRLAQHLGLRRGHGALSLPVYGRAHQRIFGAAYSSLSREPSEGQSAIVTGSARGIGKAIALRLAADGYDVCVNDLGAHRAACDDLVGEIRGMGRRACTAVADVTKRDEVEDMIQTSVRELGPLRTMVANAGIVQVRSLLDLSEDEVRRMLDVNVVGVHNCFAAAAKQLISQEDCAPDRPGKLLAASSIVGFKAFPLMGHYSASKWAVRGLVEAYAMDMGKRHITVNAYAPGIVDTRMWRIIDEGVSTVTELKKGEVMGTLAHSMTALDRVSVPEDVAKMASFLASSDSDFVTGQTLLVDGGIVFT
ncbi:hypothetical protein F4802DRAFT_549879 [Xylaria palmicola]|nr:hypothetical protein F4802DRAFT_549879 [Xylaria palmicola]